ncbi:MAG: hypothetical protein LC102_06745 [Ignavibacteriales bacterium]|nr:MAG: hypothetical protein F9K26_11765 [Ignavibacteriaceae bacterium]MBW7874007.1 hypothetical protein [Ignavibacteria bacterium]MCZ2143107.1 hypothetical protein [Ignavibacteriales bacterium]OQY75736.1 MAG: hypothetical protein B6D45_05280 [Ignavibacteriales bacterium UTCHB3]MBV6443988.1 hypothetical protein [Ignavibacteriaceae bacterium]
MKKRKIIPALIFLVILAAVVTALPGFLFKKEISQKVKSYEMTGANLIEPGDYVRFCRVNADKGEFPDISIFYDRMLNHPYIKNLEMALGEGGKARIKITEKEIVASVSVGGKLMLLSKELEVLPVMKELKNFDWPVILNTKAEKVNYFSPFPDSTILTGYKIASACNILGGDLAANLSEIDLRRGGNVVLVFSDMKPPVIMDKNSIAGQILALKKIREMGKELEINDKVEYIDLRYSGKVYLGKSKKSEKKDDKRDNNRS